MKLINLANMERELTKVLFKMETRGIAVSKQYCKDALLHEQSMLKLSKASFYAMTGREFRDSNKLFAEIFTEAGEKFPVTEKGNPSFNADALAEIDSPTARSIKKIRHHDKRAGTYYSSFLAEMVGLRIHASANQAGTTTGRMSYSNPNLQNVPKEDDVDEQPFYVRGCFIPSPDNTLVSIDFEQQEYRMMLDYAGEKKIIAQVMDGMDVHQATAELMGVTRKYAKTLNFALLYGSGVAKLAWMLNVSEKEAADLKRLYFSKLPMVKNFIYSVRNKGEARGYIYNWFGRRMHIDGFNESYKLPNHLIQGGCADVCKLAMTSIDKELGDVGMIVQVHDELVFDMNSTQLEKIPRIMQIMESIYPPKNGMKLTVSCDHSYKSWAFVDKKAGIPC